jgi:hypothetical protein
MAVITDIKDDPKISILAVLTITLNSGTIVTKSVPKSLINTEEKAKAYLVSLEKAKAVAPASKSGEDLSFLKGIKS